VIDLLSHLLRAPPAAAAAETVSEWWTRSAHVRRSFERPIEAAVAGGLAADRLGFAFAAGYHAALSAIVQ
jgi:hypothetical protein